MKAEFKSKLFVFFILIVSHLVLVTSMKSWDYNKGGSDWPEDCKKGSQAPLDISQPFTYKISNISFSYSNMMTQYSFFNDGNNLILEGDFGLMNYNNNTFFSNQIQFFSPSMHTFSNKRLPLEMQILHQDPNGNLLTVSVMFKMTSSDYSFFLGKLGFDKKELQDFEPFKPRTIKEEINLSKYVSDGKDFFFYEAVQAAPPCTIKQTYLILTDVLKVSKKQLDNFPLIIKNKNRIIQQRGEQKIYTTFKMEDVKKKVEVIKQKLAALKAVKDDQAKIQMMVDKKNNSTKINKNSNSTTNSSTDLSKKFNKTSIEKVQNELQKIKDQNKTSFNETDIDKLCGEKDIMPFNSMKDQAKAYDDYIKSDDIKTFGNAAASNESLIVDKDLPKSDSEIKRQILETKYKAWKQLYLKSSKKSSNKTQLAPHLFVQMRILEKELKENKYAPYMKDQRLSIDNDFFFSFLQLSNDHDNPILLEKTATNSNTRTSTTMKTVESLAIEARNAILNSSNEDMNKIIDNFLNTVKKNEATIEKAKVESKIEEPKKIPLKSVELGNTNKIKSATLFKTDDIINKDGMFNPNKTIADAPHISVSANPDNKTGLVIKSNQGELLKNILSPNKISDNAQIIAKNPVQEKLKNMKNIFDKINNNLEKHTEKEDILINNQKKVPLIGGIKNLLNKLGNQSTPKLEKSKLSIISLNDKLSKMNSMLNKMDKEFKLNSNKNVDEVEIKPQEKILQKIKIIIPTKSLTKIDPELENAKDNMADEQKSKFDKKMNQYNTLKSAFSKQTAVSNEALVSNEENKVNSVLINEKNDKASQELADQNSKISYVSENKPEIEETINITKENTSVSANIDKFEKIKNVSDVLAHSFKVKQNTLSPNEFQHDIKQITKTEPVPVIVEDIFDTNLDYNKKIFNTIKIVLDQLVGELKQLDNINSKVYHQGDNNFLTREGYIRITTQNLANLIRKVYNLDSDHSLSYDDKISKIYDYSSRVILAQGKNLEGQSGQYTDLTNIDLSDINKLVNKVMLKNELNQYEIKNIDKPKQLKSLVVKILQKLPIILLNFQSNVSNESSADSLSSGKDKVMDTGDIFITKNNVSNLRKDAAILGPKIKEKMEEQLSPQPGQGRKSVSRDGTLDKTEIQDTTSWPAQCKSGVTQSPININKPYTAEETKLVINLSNPQGKTTLTNDGYKIVLRADSFGYISHGAHQFIAKDIEIHHPSEHTFGDDEIRSPLEIQIICQDMFGNTAAISVLFKIDEKQNNDFLSILGFGVDNPLFALKLRNNEDILLDEIELGDKLNLGKYLNNNLHYVTYIGSLTSPPCKQNVQWFVLLQKLTVTQNQLEYFPVLFGRESNIRGIQPLNNRPMKII